MFVLFSPLPLTAMTARSTSCVEESAKSLVDCYWFGVCIYVDANQRGYWKKTSRPNESAQKVGVYVTVQVADGSISYFATPRVVGR